MSENQAVAPANSTTPDSAKKPLKKVITYGSFDLFHEGHYRLLERAKALGDYLIVGVTTEQYDESRGKLNIVDSLADRIEHVRQTGFADEIIVEDHIGQKVEDIQKYNVSIFAIGSDWEGKFEYLRDYCDVVYLERTKNVSSTLMRLQKTPIIRIGIIGTGRIAQRFVPEAKYVSGVTVQGVYNPHGQHATEFADHFSLEIGTDNINQFFDEVDAVYIASPHETHADYVRQALAHGKHVLCEKPLAFSATEAQELYNMAHDANRILMEAIKTAYCPGFAQLIGVARSGMIGSIRDVEAAFSRLTPQGLREWTDTAYGGSFTEFGSYTLLPIFKLFGTEYESLRFDSILAPNGVDSYTKASFRFSRGLATTKTGIGVKTEGQLVIAGTNGYILAKSPWWLTRSFEVRYEDPNRKDEHYVNFLGDGLRYEISDFAYQIAGYQGRAFKLLDGESVAMARVLEQFIRERRQRAAGQK